MRHPSRTPSRFLRGAWSEVALVSLVLLGSLAAVPLLPSSAGSPLDRVTGLELGHSPLSLGSERTSALMRNAFPSYALGAHPGRLDSPAGCSNCAYYMQEGATIEQTCFSGAPGSCTTYAGYNSIYEDVVIQNSPYHTGYELNGLTNTGDWFQAVVLLNWGGVGLNSAEEVWDNAGASVYGAGFPYPRIAIGDNVELGLYVSQSGLTVGEGCLSVTDLTNPQGTFTNCISQPDPGSTPSSNYFRFGASSGYFTGPMTEIYDTSATSCLSYLSMPSVTYHFTQGAYVTQFTPWSDEWVPSTGAVCYSTFSTSLWTMSPGDTGIQVVDASAASSYGPHWEGARNTSAFNPSTWWAFSTDFTLPIPAPTPSSIDVGYSSTVTFSEPIWVEHIDTNPTYSGWSSPSLVLSGCTVSGSGWVLTCTPTGVAGSVTIQFDLGESGGYQLSSPPLTFWVYSDPTVAAPTANRASADVGQGVTFSATTSGGSGGFAFTWLGLPAGCGGTSASVTCSSLTAAGTSSLRVIATDSNGHSATSAALSFTVYSDPIVITPSASRASVDLGQPVSFSAIGWGGSGGLAFSWSGLPTGCSGTTMSITCSPTTASTGAAITSTVTDSNGYSVTSPALSFSVFPLPSTTLTVTSTNVLEGGTVTFTAAVSGGAGGQTYVWTGLPSGCTGLNSFTITCSPSVVGTFTVSVTATDANGKGASATVNLAVSAAFLGLPAAQGYGLVAFLVALICGAILVIALLARRRGRPTNEAEPSISERVQRYSGKTRPSPVGDIKVPLSEVWSNRTPAPVPPGVSEGEAGPERNQASAGRSGYWDSPLLSPPDPHCWNCQLENSPASRYCARCGLPLEPPPQRG